MSKIYLYNSERGDRLGGHISQGNGALRRCNFLIRVMGKRQIGELQPAEFVVTMLVSEIASIPMQDNTIPILNSISALFVLVAYEVITSAVSLKSYKFRAFMQGHPIIVIRDGVIDIKALKKCE